MQYSYLARTRKGEVQTGTIEAPNQATALQILQSHNLIVIKLAAVERMSVLIRKIKIFERVRRKDLFIFFRQLATLVGADVPLVQSLRSLARQVERSHFGGVIWIVADDVDGGSLFSKALAKHPKVFSEFSINLIKSGEVAGRLQESLNYLADHLEKEYSLVSRVRRAMVYPAFILATFLVIGVLVMVMVMPGLAGILEEAGQELPLPTRLLIALSEFLRAKGWLLSIILIIVIIFIWRGLKTEIGQAQFDKLKLRLPLLGNIFQKTYLARLADSLNALIKGGVSIIQSLSVAGRVIGNTVYRDIVFHARDEVKVGRSISSALEKHEEFPPLFCQMIKTGERTGKLDVILEKLSIFYSREVENIVDNLSQLIEPILIVCLGVAVSILVFAVYMPIYNLAGSL